MVKLNYLSKEQALQMICLIKSYYDDNDWVIAWDSCSIVVYDNSIVAEQAFARLVKLSMGIDVEWQDRQLSILWKGGAE